MVIKDIILTGAKFFLRYYLSWQRLIQHLQLLMHVYDYSFYFKFDSGPELHVAWQLLILLLHFFYLSLFVYFGFGFDIDN